VFKVSGRSAGSFSVSGPPLDGKEAAAVTETSHRIDRRVVTSITAENDQKLEVVHWFFVPI
jgi:hypothetical protein